MLCRRGCKALKDGHCAFIAHSTQLTTLRNMASAHKIFKLCWLYRDSETDRPCCKRGTYVRSALPADRKLPARIHALILKKKVFSVPLARMSVVRGIFHVPRSVVTSHFPTPCLSLDFNAIR